MHNLDNMFWNDVNDIGQYTENTIDNKTKPTRKTVRIVLASIQLLENFSKGLKSLSVYEASSIIKSEANWIKHSDISEFKDEHGEKIKINVGTIYYIDYGKTFHGELAYYHYGLCVGKKNDKILIIPITSGSRYFSTCYHPINNPDASKKYRQALMTEGFSKDCVLKIDDTKFISSGRIIKETVAIDLNILSQIQEQLFSLQLPTLYQKYKNDIHVIERNAKKISDQKELISQLKQEKNHLKQLNKNLQNQLDKLQKL